MLLAVQDPRTTDLISLIGLLHCNVKLHSNYVNIERTFYISNNISRLGSPGQVRSGIEDNQFALVVLPWAACVLVSPGPAQHGLNDAILSHGFVNVPGTVGAQGEVTGETVVPAHHTAGSLD